MNLTASDFYSYLRPGRCARRVYLRHIGAAEEPASPYDQVLERLGQRHEEGHLSSFPEFTDLSKGSREERRGRTVAEVQRGAKVLYQPVLEATEKLSGVDCRILGEPDFLIRNNGGYIVRDSKMSRRINQKDHPEILGQLTTYGWLYERAFGAPAVRLEVHSGTGEIVPVPYEPQPALQTLGAIAEIRGLDAEPYGPVGWTKCGDCGFRSHCWKIAEEKRTVDLIYGVDQSLAAALHAEGVDTIEDLMARFDSTGLAEFKRPWGNRMQRVGKQASLILVMAEALRSGRQIIVQPPTVPDHPNYVMFDLEGLPPQLDELDKIYLWGMQVFGANPSTYLPAVAGFGGDGDRQGWQQFQRIARTILDEYGDIPFVHWASYERSRISSYVDRFGDPDGIARRVLGNLVDLLTITKDSVALPLPSYSLKVVEQYIGFRRTQHEYGGDWSIAKFIEATETEDASTRQELMNEILTYNHEDLEATWAVLTWLKGIGR